MKSIVGYILSILLAMSLFSDIALASPCDHTDTTFNCVFFKGNHDGDTIRVDIPNVHPLLGDNVPVRLRGVDTPELSAANDCEKMVAKVAKDRILEILKGSKKIKLVNVGRGGFFRILADVHVEKYGSLSKVLLDEGLAVRYKAETETDWCASKHYKK